MGDMADWINQDFGENYFPHDEDEYEEVIIHHKRKVDQTNKAVLYELKNGALQWIPKSLHDDYEDGSLGVARWFAEKEGLIE